MVSNTSTTSIDEISFNIKEFNLGEKLVVSVNFLYQKLLQKTSSYTFTYSNTVPSKYNYGTSTFPFPYYLPDDVSPTFLPTLSSFSTNLFDIYIINGLILPSIKHYENIFRDITDLITLSALTFSVTTTNNNIKVDYTFPTNIFFSSTNYLYIDGPTGTINSYQIDGPTGTINQNITDTSLLYNIYTILSNPYTSFTNTTSSNLIYITGATGSNLTDLNNNFGNTGVKI
jgi:hypothetical protein